MTLALSVVTSAPFWAASSVLTILLIVALVWLIRMPGDAAHLPPLTQRQEIEQLFPVHCRYFSAMRQVLSRTDEEFLQGRLPSGVQRQWRAERRHVARKFLKGLGEDFVRLDRLARTVAALSPEINREHEAKRFWLGMRFRVMYRMVEFRLAFQWVPLQDIARLADLIGSLAARMEAAMAALERDSASQLGASLSA